MTYFIVSDDFYDHPKVMNASDSALGLWVRAGSWSGRHLSDGHIPQQVLSGLRDQRHQHVYRDAQRLAEIGLWEPAARGGFQFHDWADVQTRLREDVLRDRTAARIRMRERRALQVIQGGRGDDERRADDEYSDPRYGIRGGQRARQEQLPGAST